MDGSQFDEELKTLFHALMALENEVQSKDETYHRLLETSVSVDEKEKAHKEWQDAKVKCDEAEAEWKHFCNRVRAYIKNSPFYGIG